ncbi:MAG: heparinase II/III family protein, partial [Ignavibacteriaceae bacterium]|nr:heparinase II/III family protein [Ignavibacteriaceae bacterium]
MPYLVKRINYSFLRKKIFRREVEASFYSNRKFPLPVVPKIKEAGIQEFKKLFPFRFFNDLVEWNSSKLLLGKLEVKNEIILNAGKLLDNKFNLNGDEIELGENISWDKDYISGYQWEKNLHWKSNPFKTPHGTDIKNAWEIARFHQGISLGKAYLLTDDEKFTEKYIMLFNNFKINNPFCAGVNWVDSSEVAIRLINVVYSLSFFIDSPLINELFINDFRDFVLFHSVFIENNLDYSRHRGSSYLTNLLGLAFVGLLFKDHHYGLKNINFAYHNLEQDIRSQVHEDGISYEQSIPYHYVNLEIFYLGKVILEHYSYKFSEGYNRLLQNMFSAQYHYLREDKTVPQLGDSIASRILPFNLIDNDMNYSSPLSVGAYLFNDGNYKTFFPDGTAGLLFLFGPGFIQDYTKIPLEYIPKRSIGFVIGGHYFLRGKNIDIFVEAGEIGRRGEGAPGHSDIFSFELNYHGQQFIIDPGTYSIFANPDLRNRFRSIRNHNSVYVDDMQISHTHPKILEWKSNNDEDILSFQHFAYIKFPDPVICKRTFIFNKEILNLKIKDELIGGAEHLVNANIHFHPSVLLEKIGDNHYFASH